MAAKQWWRTVAIPAGTPAPAGRHKLLGSQSAANALDNRRQQLNPTKNPFSDLEDRVSGELQMKQSGVLDFVALLVATTFGILNAPFWTVAIVVALLAIISFVESADTQRRLTRAGAAPIALAGMFASVAAAASFATICFLIGRGIAVLGVSWST
jgi:hypothetical protein